MQKRGALMVEFAIILPIFLLLFIGMIYTAMFIFDYTRLNDLARSAARYGTVQASGDYDKNNPNKKIQKVKEYIKENKNNLILYDLPDTDINVSIVSIANEDSIQVELVAKKTDKIPVAIDEILPEDIKSILNMRIES